MAMLRTNPESWPLDGRKLMPPEFQRASWVALADARDLLADIALTARLLAGAAFSGQEAARQLAMALNSALLALEVEMGCQGVVQFAASQPDTKTAGA